MIIGAGEVGRTVMRNIIAQPELGYRVVGFLDDDPGKSTADIGPIKALGPIEDVPAVIREHRIDQVIVTLPWQYHRKTVRLVMETEDTGARARVVPDLFQLSLGGVDVESINGIPLISIKQTALTGWNLALKRGLDLLFTIPFIALTSPVWLLIAIAIKLDSPGPVFYRQERAGKSAKPFQVLKFRSMRVGADAEQAQLLAQNEASGPLFKMRDDPRRTRVGRVIRQMSLDELPQFINVLRGEMSVVGPRPALFSEVAQYQDWQRKRLEMGPGIRALAGQRAQRSDLRRDGDAGYLLRRELVVAVRYSDHAAHDTPDPLWRWSVLSDRAKHRARHR